MHCHSQGNLSMRVALSIMLMQSDWSIGGQYEAVLPCNTLFYSFAMAIIEEALRSRRGSPIG